MYLVDDSRKWHTAPHLLFAPISRRQQQESFPCARSTRDDDELIWKQIKGRYARTISPPKFSSSLSKVVRRDFFFFFFPTMMVICVAHALYLDITVVLCRYPNYHDRIIVVVLSSLSRRRRRRGVYTLSPRTAVSISTTRDWMIPRQLLAAAALKFSCDFHHCGTRSNEDRVSLTRESVRDRGREREREWESEWGNEQVL